MPDSIGYSDQFDGVIFARGLDLPAGTDAADPDDETQIRWVEDPGGGLVAQIYAATLGGGSIRQLVIAQQPDTATSVAELWAGNPYTDPEDYASVQLQRDTGAAAGNRVKATARFNAGAVVERTIIDAAGNSDFALAASVAASLALKADIAQEAWRVVGAAGQPAFAGAWVNFGAPWQAARFFKDTLGIVHVQGLVKNGAAAPSTVFTLPAGYRPPADLIFASEAAAVYARLNVLASGVVQYGTGGAAPGSFSLNCSFRV